MSSGAIKPTPVLEAPADLMAAARANCAARVAARGQEAEAQRYRAGENDQGWGIRHEVAKLRAERARGEA